MTYPAEEVAPQGVFIAASEPSMIQVVAFDYYSGAANSMCNSLDPSVVVAQQTPSTVTLATFAYQQPPPTGTTFCAASTIGDQSLYTEIVVHLGQPLGSRKLLDAKTGRLIGVLAPAAPPSPTYVPSGYTQSFVSPFSPSNPLALRQFRDGVKTIEIRVRSGTVWDQRGTVLSTLQINGVNATATDDNGQRCLSWPNQTGLVYEVCSLGTAATLLPVTELTKIARSLR